MAVFINTSGEDREVAVDGQMRFVAAGASFIVPDDLAPSFASQPHFTDDLDPVETVAQKAPVLSPAPPVTPIEGV